MDITLEESTTDRVSQPLQKLSDNILEHSQSMDSVQKDLFTILIIVAMLENGFVPLEKDIDIKDSIEFIDHARLHSWKSSAGVLKADFVLQGFKNVPLQLILSPLGAMVIVNVTISNLNNETYSVCLPVSKYVVSPHASTVPMIYRDLKHLSQTFKNNVLAAVKSRILTYCGYSSPSLPGIPVEILLKIMLFLSIRDIVNIGMTCRLLYSVLDDNTLWHQLFKRDFSKVVQNIDVTDCVWKEQYIKYYLEEKDKIQRSQQRTAGTLHDYMQHSDFMSYIDNPLLWDII